MKTVNTKLSINKKKKANSKRLKKKMKMKMKNGNQESHKIVKSKSHSLLELSNIPTSCKKKAESGKKRKRNKCSESEIPAQVSKSSSKKNNNLNESDDADNEEIDVSLNSYKAKCIPCIVKAPKGKIVNLPPVLSNDKSAESIDSSEEDVSLILQKFVLYKGESCIESVGSDVDTLSQSALNTPHNLVFHPLPDDKMALVIRYPERVFLRGKLKLRVLLGVVEVLGYDLSTENTCNGVVLYSSERFNLLSLEPRKTELNQKDTDNASNILGDLGLEQSQINSILANLENNECLIVCEKFTDPVLECLLLYSPITLFWKVTSDNTRPFFKAENKLQCQFELQDSATAPSRLYNKGSDWEDIAQAAIETKSKIVVCGGKGVGKSTLLKFLVNRALTKFKKVLYLDFDIGQTEFTVPGCVSATVVTKPLLGPNFTHAHLQPVRLLYVGDVDASRCAEHYARCTENLIDYCYSQEELQNIPWFCNTMGFNRGLGIELMVHLIRSVKPTHLIQIYSNVNKLNFPDKMRKEWISERQSIWNTKHSKDKLNYVTIDVNSALRVNIEDCPRKRNDTPGEPKPRDLRQVMTLAYFSKIIKPPFYSLLAVETYKTPLADLKISVNYTNFDNCHILSVINGSLVALCSTKEEAVAKPSDTKFPFILLEQPVSHVMGFGIVRGIDMEEKVIYLITPLPEDKLCEVNCLVMGSITPPNCFYTCTEVDVGQVPYVVVGSGHPTSRMVHRIFRPPQRK